MARPSAEEIARARQYLLGETTLGELSDFADEVRACLVRIGMSHGHTRDEMLTVTENALDYGNGRKMVSVGLPPGPFWNPSIVKLIQSEVLSRHQGWSVVLTSYGEEPTLEILAEAIRDEQGKAIPNLSERLEKMRLEREAYEKLSKSWYRRQGAILRTKLAYGLLELKDGIPFVLMGVFHGYRKAGYHVGWLLTSTAEFGIYLQAITEEAAQTGNFYVDADGHMTEKSWRYVDGERVDIDYKWIIQGWLIPEKYHGDQLLVAQDEREVEGVTTPARKWRVPFSRSQIIHD